MTSKLIVCVFFAVLLVGIFPRSIARQGALGIDYPIFYRAAQNHGDAPGYVYPPTLAWLLMPLAVLPLHVSVIVWYWLMAGAILLAIWRCLPDESPRNLMSLLIEIAVLAAFARLVILNQELGQVNPLVLLSTCYAIKEWARPRAGPALGVATLIKLSPVVFLPFVAVQTRSWGVIIALVVTILLGMGLPLVSGFTFSGMNNLAVLSESASDNLGLFAYGGKFSIPIVVVVLTGSLFIGWKARAWWETWLIPVLLMMIFPPVVRKAHLIYGLPLVALLERQGSIRWVPLLWAAGTLGTVWWEPSAIVGNAAALSVLCYKITR